MIRLSKYKLAFLAGFVFVPGAIWAFQVSPTLADRVGYVQRQENAKAVQARNRLLPTQRDELRESWTEFKPVADAALADIGNDLNPHLVQKRMNDLAAATGCKVIIQPMNQQDGDYAVRFQMSGKGSYQSLVKFVDQLEQGQHFVRFESLSVSIPPADRGGAGAANLTATAMIPLMPEGIPSGTESKQ